MESIATLNALGRYRWTVPVLAMIGARAGGRFSELANRIGLPRESLSRTLDAAIAAGWLIRNPGHGHPLRPEYVLTAEGVRIAEACRAIVAAQHRAALPPDAMTRWSLPVIRLIADGENRFNAIARALDGATPRALAGSLKALAGHALVDRQVLEGYPPLTTYALTPRGGMIARAL
jgi:DNA-binding HxlR family transcriptional regulator